MASNESIPQQENLNSISNRPLTIVNIGKTGQGKSSTANSILLLHPDHLAPFAVGNGPNSRSQEVATHIFKPNGIDEEVMIVDTIGLYDTKLTNPSERNQGLHRSSFVDEKHSPVLAQFTKVMEVCENGIDAFLFVVKGSERATEEALDTINIIFQHLGWVVLDYAIFVITGKDEITEEDFKAWKQHICEALKSRNYETGFAQFVFVDNKNPTEEQALEILSKVKYVKELRNEPYTNLVFENAQITLVREKEEIKKRLEEEFQQKLKEKTDVIEQQHNVRIKALDDKLEEEKKKADQLTADMIEERREQEEKIKALEKRRDEELSRKDAAIAMATQLLTKRMEEEGKIAEKRIAKAESRADNRELAMAVLPAVANLTGEVISHGFKYAMPTSVPPAAGVMIIKKSGRGASAATKAAAVATKAAAVATKAAAAATKK